MPPALAEVHKVEEVGRGHALFPLPFELKPGASCPRRPGRPRFPVLSLGRSALCRAGPSPPSSPNEPASHLTWAAVTTRSPSAPSPTSSPSPPARGSPASHRRLERGVGRERAGRVLGFHLCSCRSPQSSSGGSDGNLRFKKIWIVMTVFATRGIIGIEILSDTDSV